MANDVDTLATALCATTDDMLKEHPDLAPWCSPVDSTPRLSNAELVTLAMMQAILGFTSEAKRLRRARAHLRHLFRYLPQQPGYNKRLRKAAGLMRSANRIPATTTSVWSDDAWVVDSTPVECGRSHETVKRSGLAGWAEYGYCVSHRRFFWGLHLHLVCTLQGLPIAFGLTGAKANERETLLDLLAAECELLRERQGQTLIGDKNYFGRDFERELSELGVQLLRPARKGERERPGAALLKPLRLVIESINETFKGQLDLERHRGRTPGGVIARVMQRILALTAAIWHNEASGQTVLRSLIAYDH
ncbi:IS982 family transposase [Streptomyces sp. NPDC005731]|uniref:IS982 family transposase n=1 Tax=Streptomyces sp. NPDC005731 TaxID=3157056 RepID=UPI0033F27961